MSWLWQPGSALRLGLSRAIFYAWFFLQVLYYQPTQFAGLPESLWYPVYLLAPWGAPSSGLFYALVGVLQVSQVTACLGLWTRLSCWLVAISATAVLGWMNCYGGAEFHLTPLVLASWILAFSACGEAFSWDARRRVSRPPDAVRFGWPIRLIWLSLILPMASAGLLKFLGTWAIAPADTMASFIQFKMLVHAQLKDQRLWPGLSRLLTQSWLLGGLAWATLLLECACPLALLDRPGWLRPFFVVGLFLMQLTLAVAFYTLESFPWLAMYAFWVPWDRLLGGRGALASKLIPPRGS